MMDELKSFEVNDIDLEDNFLELRFIVENKNNYFRTLQNPLLPIRW